MSVRVKLAGLCLVAIMLLSGALLFANATRATTPDAYDAKESYELAQSALLYLRVMNSSDTVKTVGSGVIVSSDGTAVTAYHVVKGGERIEGVLSDGTVIGPIQLRSYDELTDAAVLQLPSPKTVKRKGGVYPTLPLREPALRHGDRLYALGYPMKDTPIITEGIVSHPSAQVNGRARILTTAAIVSGMSGGPVLDEQGRLSGIISGSMRTMNGIHLVISMEDVRSLLGRV